ncbi:MAG TPA: acyl CoA:acetate/3-ketoacid CoA transferase [Candidatus Intestinimonas merdavium]|uniref:Acyl CoA:acetate/3-ketoacid CoA transferase n=1 Tax=Candidatus Intestinimonas merdavium TaxID=2838622 RepID=A0A9D1Z218_9FIRM|nr:acyl CoA:acetate/3-ketoacid CoA transferase [Candidatus Intestinimonas merdavium]
MYQVITGQQAANLVKDGSTVVSTGFIGSSFPEYVISSIEKSFLETGHPAGLTVSCSAGIGDHGSRGFSHFGHEGLVSRAICGHYDLCPELQKLVDGNKLAGYLMPQGTLTELYREIGSGRPGVITKIGLRTFADPRLEGGRCNEKATESLIELITLDGEEYLWYKSFPVDVGIIRGTSVDENGNLTIEKESTRMDQLAVAQAAKHCGGIVIAQVERIVSNGSLNPRDVLVPGILIDYVVISPPEMHCQDYSGQGYNAALAHEFRIPVKSLPPLEMSERKIIARRSAMELISGGVTNLGIGMPEGISSVTVEEGVSNEIIMSVESGHIGGVPAAGLSFGGCYNSEYVSDMTRQFDFYDGGGLDIGFLGAAEVDGSGNVNVSKFKKTVGPGGFINIAQSTKNMVFCGTLTAGGLKVAVQDNKLIIVQEGRNKKFVKKVQQVTFSGDYAKESGQKVLYVTERAVFELTEKGVTLVEIAPGIDLQTQILDQVEFPVAVSPDLREMDARIFGQGPMGLKLKERL